MGINFSDRLNKVTYSHGFVKTVNAHVDAQRQGGRKEGRFAASCARRAEPSDECPRASDCPSSAEAPGLPAMF